METNATIKKPAIRQAAAGGGGPPVRGPPAPNSDVFLFINAQFRYEFEACAALTKEDHDVVTFEADLVQKLNDGNTLAYVTSLRVPRGCMMRAKMHPIFRRMLVQSMWLQMQPGMLRYRAGQTQLDPKTPPCYCANPPCTNRAVRFVGNPGFFPKKNLLIDPMCIPVCNEAACVLQAQQMSNTIHAQAAAGQPQHQQSPSPSPSPSKFPTGSSANNLFAIDTSSNNSNSNNNPALKSQMPKSVQSCNMCESFEQKYGGTASILRACPLCKIAHYCSQQCQIQDWQRGHKDVCVNAQGQGASSSSSSAAVQAAQQEQAKSNKPATIAEEDASAPAPAHAPAPAPAPAPMPLTAVQQQQQQQQRVTQAMAAMAMPSATAAPVVTPKYGMPSYNMVEPDVVVPPPSSSSTAAAKPAYKSPTFQMPATATAAALNATPAPIASATTVAAATSSMPTASLPTSIKKGRKKAE